MADPDFKTFPTKTYVEIAYCPECGEELEWGGITLTSNPPWYPHRCPACDYKQNLRSIYPREFRKFEND